MLVAAFIMVVGIAVVAALSHRAGYRLGGVMTIPLLVIYTFREPLSPAIFIVGTAAAYGALWATREYTLNHGRRVFLIAALIGAVATILATYVISYHTPIYLPFDDAEVVASIFPGVAAYNLMRLDPDRRTADVGLMAAVFASLTLLGVAGLFLLEGRPTPTPAVLSVPTSDLVTWLGVEPRGELITQVIPDWLTVSLLVADVAIYEGVRGRYDLRLAGIVIIPLIAVFSVRLKHTFAIFAVGATVVFVLLSTIHWLSLLYGRVLLGISLILGSLYVLFIGAFTATSLPGLTLFFLGLFVGVAAYNLHRVSPSNRPASLRLSAGLFVVFYTVLVFFVDIPPTGLFVEHPLVYAFTGVVILCLAGVELYRLERARPSITAFARSSVFANASVDGADVEASPLVYTDETSHDQTPDSVSGDD